MSVIITASVTKGYTFIPDANGKILITKDRLHDLGTPQVTVDLDDGVTTAALKDNAVTVAKLSEALQDVIPKISLSGTNDQDGTGSMDLQVQDAGDTALSQRFKIRTWISDSDFGAPTAKTDFSVSTGTQLQEIVANADYEAISDGTGLVKMNINLGVSATVYVMAEIDGRIYSASLAITI